MNKSTMSIKGLIATACALPANISVMIRGDHGIGKSEVTREIASRIASRENIEDYEVIDRRMSQMSEGDIIGLPELKDGSTRFCVVDWFAKACEKPVLLFLDELNRATPEVMQAVFQIALDRELNGRKLHPQSRVFVAINSSHNYNVNTVDPALLDRFWVADLAPSNDEWIEWAQKNGVDEDIVNFIQNEPKYLDPVKDDPEGVQPSRRSWVRASKSLAHAGISGKPDDPLYFNVLKGFVSDEVAVQLVRYAKDHSKRITAEEVLNDWDKIQDRVSKLGPERLNIICEKLGEHFDKDTTLSLEDHQVKNLRSFVEGLPHETIISSWRRFCIKNLAKKDLIKGLHKAMVKAIVTDVFGVPLGKAGIGVQPRLPGFFQDGKFVESAPPAPAEDASATAPAGATGTKKTKKKK